MAALRHAALAEEAAEVEVLSANLSKLKSLSKKIEGSMGRLEASGRMVQDGIGPVMGNTQELQTIVINATSILTAIGKVREPLDKRKGEERILREHPDRVGLPEYIASMDRTNQHLRDLKASKMRSNEKAISEMTQLLQTATQNLELVFREICRLDCVPIEPLRFITKSTDFPRLPSAKSSQLRTINQQIASSTSLLAFGETTPSEKGYASERGQYITLSLQNLASACLSTARRMNSTQIYTKNSCGIGSYADSLQGMYLAEYDNICSIFNREEWRSVISATCNSSLAAFSSTLKELDTHVKASIITDCYLAYEIVDVVSIMSFELDKLAPELKQSVSDALKPVRETAKSSLNALLTDMRVKVQQLVGPSPDGAAVPMTTEVMQRLELMMEYIRPLSSILRSLGDGGWSSASTGSGAGAGLGPTSFDVGADGAQLFSHYCADTIDSLLSNLDGRGKALHRTKMLQSVFLANNVAVIERLLRASYVVDGLARSTETQAVVANVQPKLDMWKKRAAKDHLDGWRDVSKELLDVQYTSKQQRPPSTGSSVDSAAIIKSMGGKDKDGIKEKFRAFNAAFEDHVARYKACKMEPEVRRQLGKEVQSFIEPLYSRFWERYHEIDKGKGKYVKYDKAQLSSMLANL